MTVSPVRGVLFDKDGTLVDFRRTWDAWAQDLITDLAGPDETAIQRLADAMCYDVKAGAFLPHSPVIACTAQEAAELVAKGLARDDVKAIQTLIETRARVARMVPVVPLPPLLTGLRRAGLVLGVATNDAESVARENLHTLGLTHLFDYVAGYDSGYGAKPGGGMVRQFCEEMAIAPAHCVMVGDSPHDLHAAIAAGARPVAVLTGIYSSEDLSPLAEAILPDIGALPGWLGMAEVPA